VPHALLILLHQYADVTEFGLMALTAMVVDEEPPVLSLAKAGLEPLGCEVVTQSDGREAATVAQTRKIHLVLFGTRMEPLDGFELTRVIRRSKLNSHIPIVMMAAGYDTNIMRRGIHEGIHFFLAKPLSQERIVQFFRTMRRAMWKERRRYSRLPLRVTATCRSSIGTLELQTRNISIGGMLLEPCEGLTRCQEIGLELSIPGYDRAIQIPASVRHQTPEVGVGAKFQDVSAVGRRAIDGYISGTPEKQL
jgi:CheY-like chemotaxis protein